jgi:ATP-binding cassette subfamily B protein
MQIRPDPFRPANAPPPDQLWAFLRWALKGSWPIIAIDAFLSAMAGSMEVISALLLGWVIDTTLATPPAEVFSANLGLIAGFCIFYLLVRPMMFGLSAASTNLLLMPTVYPQVLARLHRWTLGQSVSFFDNDFAGRIAQKQTQTANAVTQTVSEINNTGFFALSSMIGSIAVLMGIETWGAIALAVWMCLYFGLIRAFLPHVRRRSQANAGARALVTGQIVDTITNIKTVKLFGHAAHEDRAALDAMQGYRRTAETFGVVTGWYRLAQMALSGLLPVILLGLAIAMWQRGTASAGDIAAAGAISIRIAQMSGWVSMALMGIWRAVGEVEDGMKTLTAPHSLVDRPGAQSLHVRQGAIRFEQVSFAYGQAKGGIDGIDLTIRPGEKIGIVGASGAGKSTLVALLLRLYDCEKGRILIDGTDISGCTQDSLRRAIGMVTQETAMFNRSAHDNILYGRPEASDAEVIAAASAAEAHDFIQGLGDHKGNHGYDAMLGERGVKLSGGQRQRIALARAFLKDAPILVLDEATSALDSEVEAQVQSALHRVMQGKTVLAIAHRLSTIAEMDRIVVLDQGRIVEQGSHADLLALGGFYARYWNRQSGGFIGCDETNIQVE